jgi:hypothetical protein
MAALMAAVWTISHDAREVLAQTGAVSAVRMIGLAFRTKHT